MSDRSGEEDDDDWQTPQWLYDKLDAEFKFDFDPCPIRATFDGLVIPWGKSNFINPPYNRRDKPKFIKRAYDEWQQGGGNVRFAYTSGDWYETVSRSNFASCGNSVS